ncbi:gas vesicle accessory protein GvpU [Halobacillus sp. Marseille-Q1614]|uniref:gas vesicle accessory protein GvpU n=1 Tax=Halobacillus sp. Marseille-Q1614 TaxID=2709134 RepID=UPI00157150A8|nr:gas vesicle accessory protein GvpU [Halobacillus sp. Marseille-Q1614]
MDDVLQTFVKAANNYDFSLDITLNVNGALISGTTMSAEEYLNSISSVFDEGNDVSQAIGEKLSQAGQSAKENSKSVSYIHLKNTRIFNGDADSTPAEGDFYWRGKLEQVDGFFLGRISSEEE